MAAKTAPDDIIGTREAMAILKRKRNSVLRYAEQGRIKKLTQLPGDNGSFLYDRKSVETLAAELELADRLKEHTTDEGQIRDTRHQPPRQHRQPSPPRREGQSGRSHGKAG